MIVPITMFGIQCDGCEAQWFDDQNGFVAFTDELTAKNVVAEDDTWIHDENVHYCPKCFTVDEEDKVIIKPIEAKALTGAIAENQQL